MPAKMLPNKGALHANSDLRLCSATTSIGVELAVRFFGSADFLCADFTGLTTGIGRRFRRGVLSFAVKICLGCLMVNACHSHAAIATNFTSEEKVQL